MRVALKQYRPNGGSAPAGQVFAITGICGEPRFRLNPVVFSGEHRSEDLALLYLGAPEFGSASSSNEEEPHFILRRAFSGSEVVVAIRIDWEGVFTVLANDEEYAERLFRELIQPCSPDEVNRGWSDDSETLAMYQQLLALA